jgi:hypothetical protein
LRIVTTDPQGWIVHHDGFHSHPVPPLTNRSLDQISTLKLEQQVLNQPDLSVHQMKYGSSIRKSITEIHPSLYDGDRIREERKKIKVKAGASTSHIADICNFRNNPDMKLFVKKLALMETLPHIIMQDDDMLKLLLAGDGPVQSDTVEDFVKEKKMTGKDKPNLTITTMYDFNLLRWVPVLITILFGRSTDHYKIYLDYFFPVTTVLTGNNLKKILQETLQICLMRFKKLLILHWKITLLILLEKRSVEIQHLHFMLFAKFIFKDQETALQEILE